MRPWLTVFLHNTGQDSKATEKRISAASFELLTVAFNSYPDQAGGVLRTGAPSLPPPTPPPPPPPPPPPVSESTPPPPHAVSESIPLPPRVCMSIFTLMESHAVMSVRVLVLNDPPGRGRTWSRAKGGSKAPPARRRRSPSRLSTASGTSSPSRRQGLTLVHFSAQRKRFLWKTGCIMGLFRGGLGGVMGH